jgi:hypothetical protein
MPDAEWCWNHHPDYDQARRRRASKGGKRGGRGRPQRETEDIKALLEDLTERVLAGELETGPAAVSNQLINTRLRALEQERKNKEAQELEARIEALERAQERGAGRWGLRAVPRTTTPSRASIIPQRGTARTSPRGNSSSAGQRRGARGAAGS